MKKFVMLGAAALVFAATPSLAERDSAGDKMEGKEKARMHHHEGHMHHKGGMMFEKGDLDGDGAISKSEFMELHLRHFKEADANGDGKLTREEVQAKHEKMREHYKEHMQKMRDENRSDDE